MAANNWTNKPVPFKRTDPEDEKRYKFARGLPNFTQTVKDMLDWMQSNKLVAFVAPTMVVRSSALREFTLSEEGDEEEFEETMEFDTEQFL